MIKATMGTDRSAGPDVLLLGLSWQNLDRLRKGQPIAFDMAEVDLPPMKVMKPLVCGGRCRRSMTRHRPPRPSTRPAT